MKVFVDATAVPANRGGVGRYVDALLPALADQGLDLVVGCQLRDETTLGSIVPTAELVHAPDLVGRPAARLAWEQTVLPRTIRRSSPDVVLSPHYTMSPVDVPTVVTLHDATFFSHAGYHGRVKAPFFRAATRRAVRRAAGLVVPSAATRDEVIRYAGGRPDRFHVAYHGVDTATFRPVPAEEHRRVARSLGLDGVPYVAFLGTLAPLKNVPNLIRGWVRAAGTLERPPALVIAGGAGWDDGVDVALAEVPAHLRALRTGYLPFDDLAGFLGGAEVVAFPSIAEGFGLPVLEAMACGAAVLTSRTSSLPEVGGDAVAYTDTDAGSIAAALVRLLTDPDGRARLGAASQARAARFTWEAAAAVHVAAFDQAVAVAQRDR